MSATIETMSATIETALEAAEARMLRRCIAVIEYMHDGAIEEAHKDAFWDALHVLRGMQEK